MRILRTLLTLMLALGLILGVAPMASAEEATRVVYEEVRLWPTQPKIGDRITVHFSRFDTANIAGTGAGVAAGAILARTPVPVWASSFVVGAARNAMYHGDKCASLQFNNYFGWLPNVSAYVRDC